MRTFTKTIAAGSSCEIREKGSFFKIRHSTGAVAVESGDQRIRLDSVETGQGIKGVGFNQLMLINNNASDVTVRFAIGEYGQGELIDNVEVTGEIAEQPCSIFGDIEVSNSKLLSVNGSVTCDPLPAGTRHVLIKSPSTNTDVINVCGIIVEPGDWLPMNLGEGVEITLGSSSAQDIFGIYFAD